MALGLPVWIDKDKRLIVKALSISSQQGGGLAWALSEKSYQLCGTTNLKMASLQ